MSGKFVVSCGDSAVFLIFSDGLFNAPTQAVCIPVVLVLDFAIGFGRNDDLQSDFLHLRSQRVAIVSLVCNQRGSAASNGLIGKKRGALMIAGLAAGEPDAPQPSGVIGDDMDFGGEPALAAA